MSNKPYLLHLEQQTVSASNSPEGNAAILSAKNNQTLTYISIAFDKLLKNLEDNTSNSKYTDKTTLASIKQLHNKFGISNIGNQPIALRGEEQNFRVAALKEEAEELNIARAIHSQADAFIDSIIFALGGLERMGLLPIVPELIAEVMRANLAKEKAESAKNSKRNYKFDLIKPRGWKAPNLKKIIDNYAKTNNT